MATPSVAAMYAPQVFHGTRGDVRVPASSIVRDRLRAFRRLRRNSSLNMRPGSTMDMYWSAVTMLDRIVVPTTEAISDAVPRAARTRAAMIRSSSPVCSITEPNDNAVMIRKIVLRKLSMPPRDNSVSTVALPVSAV